jgi:hypothetical protein
MGCVTRIFQLSRSGSWLRNAQEIDGASRWGQVVAETHIERSTSDSLSSVSGDVGNAHLHSAWIWSCISWLCPGEVWFVGSPPFSFCTGSTRSPALYLHV